MTEQIKRVHPFEIAKLGVAPFRPAGSYIDQGPKKIKINGVELESGAPGQPMGSCDYCGRGILICFRVKDSTGRSFVVGSKCIEKTTHKGHPVYTAVQKVKRARAKEQRDQRDALKITQLKTWLEDPKVIDLLKAQPHAQKWRADKGETEHDRVIWYLKNAGVKGKIEMYKKIKALIA